MYVALLLSRASCDIVRSLSVLSRTDVADVPQLIALIQGREYVSQAPSSEEMLFYDFIYSCDGALIGIELRVLDDHVRHAFAAETEDFQNVTRNVFPTIWLGAERLGGPKSSTVELFGDVWLCRAQTRQWAVVVDLDGTFSHTIDVGVLRTPGDF